MAHKTNILHKMINVNFTINEINKTLSVEPLHDFQDNGNLIIVKDVLNQNIV
mgnify:CR=1 FL=1